MSSKCLLSRSVYVDEIILQYHWVTMQRKEHSDTPGTEESSRWWLLLFLSAGSISLVGFIEDEWGEGLVPEVNA